MGWYERSPDRPILPILERMLHFNTNDDIVQFVLWFALKELNEIGIIAIVKRAVNIETSEVITTA